MIRVLLNEFRKLRGSLALLVAIAVPAILGILVFFAIVSTHRPVSWRSTLGEFVLPLWALFLLPMAVTAFTSLMGQIEHRRRAWDYILSLPFPRSYFFIAKAIVAMISVLVMTILVVAFGIMATALGSAIAGLTPGGTIPWTALGAMMLKLVAATCFLTALQLWAALRYANFVVPLSLGISGTLVALAATMTQTHKADWFPWLLPFKTLMNVNNDLYLVSGFIGGLLCFALMSYDLEKRDL